MSVDHLLIVSHKNTAVLPILSLPLIVLLVSLAPLVSPLDEVSLGLVAFTLIMWVTMPWAYAEAIDKARGRIRQTNPSLLADPKFDYPNKWLSQSQLMYLYAGLMFMFQVVVNVATTSLPPTSNLNIIPYVVVAIFLAGIVYLGFAMLWTQQVIDFVLHPEELEEVSHYGLRVVMTLRDTSYFIFFAFCGADFFLGLLYAYYSIFYVQAWYTYVEGIAFFIGVLAVIPMYRAWHAKDVRRIDFIAPAMVAIPWVTLAIVALLKGL